MLILNMTKKRRAIVLYLEDKRNLMLQFGCLYESLKYIGTKDTDLIVFGSKDALNKVPNDIFIVKIEYEPISYQPEWNNYHYINSISCIVGKQADFLEKYDLLLRSDIDCFLTIGWNNFYPEKYTVGRGGYVNDQKTKDNLKRIATKLNLDYKDEHNIGSTHYGWSKLVRQVCELALSTTKYILNNEFEGEGGWPSWYKGVSLLYGMELATNHLVKDFEINGNRLDHGSTGNGLVNEHPHIHCWHTDDMFSKFHFEAGKYDNLETDKLNLNIIKDYCLYIALKSKIDFPNLSEITKLTIDNRYNNYLRNGEWGLFECQNIKELVYDTKTNPYILEYYQELTDYQKHYVINFLG